MPQSNYDVNINIVTKDKTSAAAKSAAKGVDGLTSAVKKMAAAWLSIKGAKAVLEITKLGAAAQRQEAALDSLAKAAGYSGSEIIKSIQTASDFTIDRMTAMQVANRAMIMDVAETPAQFERLTEVAVALGRAMGVDAATSIDNFVTAAGRQSKLIADNLGLIVNAEDAYKRYADTLGVSVDELDDAAKKQAFLTEMLRQGEIKMADLGESTLDAAGQMEQASAAFKDAKTAIGEMLASLANSSGILHAVASGAMNIAHLTQSIKEHGFSVKAWAESMVLYQKQISAGAGRVEAMNTAYSHYVWAVEHADEATKKYTESIRYLNDAEGNLVGTVTILEGAQRDINPEIDRYRQYIEEASEVTRYAYTTDLPALTSALEDADRQFGATDDATLEYLESLGETTEMGRDFIAGANGIIEVLQEERRAALNANEAFINLAMQYTSYQEDVTETAQQFADERAEIESDHQEKLAALAKQGQARRVSINAAAEEEKLQDLRDKLTLAEMRYNEFTDKTAASTRLAKEMQIADLREQIATQEQLLDDHYNNRLWAKGKNVDDELAEEDRHYNEALSKLEASQKEQEHAQRQSLGRMVLAHFEAWQEMTLAVDGYTSEEAAFVQEMRLDIAKEYGLMTDEAVRQIQATERTWAAMWSNVQSGAQQTKQEIGNLVAKLKDLAQEIRNLPAEKRIKIITQYIHEGSPGATIPELTRQHGGPVRAGQPTIVGEQGIELFVPNSSGTIINNTTTQSMLDNRTININTPQGLGFLSARERAEARNRFVWASGM